MKPKEQAILIVDDRPANLLALERTLAITGAEIVQAGSGQEALAATLGREFSLAILDVQMPGMDGYELAELLRGNPETQSIPIVFLSAAFVEDWQVFKGYEAGAVDYVIKPFVPEVLLGKVRAFLELDRIRQELRGHRDRLEELVAERTRELVDELAERRRVESALRESEARYRNLFENSMDAVMLTVPDGVILSVNPAASRMFGRSREELCRLRREDLVAASDHRLQQLLEERIRTGQARGELTFLRGDGARFPGEVSSVVFRDPAGGLRSSMIIRDLTERKQAEAIRERLLMAIEQAGESIAITDPEGNIIYVNPAFEAMTGYSRAEALGQNLRLLKSGEHEPAFYQELWETITSGCTWQGRFVNLRKDGVKYNAEATISPVHGPDGEVQNYVAVERDITEHLTLTAQLQQAQKLEAIGTLAGGIAHDFNNILSAILGYTELTLNSPRLEDKERRYLEQVLAAGGRARDTVSQILAFSRRSAAERKVFFVAPIVKEALKLLRASIPTTIELQQNVTTKTGKILGDPTHIHQVLMNLCTNASHAMGPAGGVLRVSLEEQTLEPTETGALGDLAGGGYLCLQVSDTGQGMAPEVLERIFEPFFTTKGVGEGTGLGLSVVHGIVKNHGGAISVESRPGRGSTFRVWLPRVEEEEERAVPPREPLLQGRGTALFVDDEQALADLGKLMLERMGYTVQAFTSSSAALEAFRGSPEAFDVVISDHIMPQLTGVQLAREIKALRPDLPVALCTGNEECLPAESLQELGISMLIMKPFSLRALAENLRDLLHPDRSSGAGGG
ncbi:MAG: PAS domain S-box protein [Deltaproteobacteria bacterium]|nr:PAS domain S-box protein [Deltaproteobacteria bacterium]